MTDPKPLSADQVALLMKAPSFPDSPWLQDYERQLLITIAARDAEIARCREALSLFAMYADVLDGLDADGELIQPLTDHTWVAHTSFPGGGIGIAVGDLRKARAALGGQP